MACLSGVLSLLLERDILQCREGMHRNRVDRMLGQPWPDAYQSAQIHDGGKHDMLNGELLEAVQHGLALRMVPLNGLLFEERVDIGVATVGIRALRIHKTLGTCGSI